MGQMTGATDTRFLNNFSSDVFFLRSYGVQVVLGTLNKLVLLLMTCQAKFGLFSFNQQKILFYRSPVNSMAGKADYVAVFTQFPSIFEDLG